MLKRLVDGFRKLLARAGGKQPLAQAAAKLPEEVAVIEPRSTTGSTLDVKAETAVIGDNAQINIHLDKRQRPILLVGFGAVILLVIGLGVGAFLYVKSQQVTRMGGEFNIAVAGFAVQGSPDDPKLGQDVGQNIYKRLDDSLKKQNLRVLIEVWDPARAGSINGADAKQRAEAAAQLALKINANMVVYGVIDVSQNPWLVTPEFYVSERNFYETQEITGQYQLGSPFSVRGKGNTGFWVSLNTEMLKRVEALTWVTQGISEYANEQYGEALKLFQSAEAIQGWQDPQGQSVLYLLEGNAAIRANQVDVAETYYKKSLEQDPVYARAFIGLGSVYYMKALAPFNQSKDPQKLGLADLEVSERWYQSALAAKNQPDPADIDTKVHFNLGQSYFVRYYTGKNEVRSAYRQKAIEQFNAIIQENAGNPNPRVKLWLGEAHARLGLIARNEANLTTAIAEYDQAIKILDDYIDRKAIFQETLDMLRATQAAGGE